MTNHSSQIMLVLSSPSGAGKTTLTKKIQQKYKNFKISVSHTTRKARPNEINGVDYHFIERDIFKKMRADKNFYEHAEIFDNYYGTSKKSVEDLIKNKNDILFDIDWQGTQQLVKFKELDLIKIFILPPSKIELKKRLNERNHEKKTVAKRLLGYEKDSLHWNEYDYIILNDKLDVCYNQIEKIISNKKDKNKNYFL